MREGMSQHSRCRAEGITTEGIYCLPGLILEFLLPFSVVIYKLTGISGIFTVCLTLCQGRESQKNRHRTYFFFWKTFTYSLVKKQNCALRTEN